MTRRRIDDAIDDLSRIVDQTRARASYLGVFPAMYRSVTREIRRGIGEGLFADVEMLERMAVVFADRYIAAFDLHLQRKPVTLSWQIAFDVAEERRRSMVVQHLLMGMNAHINLDLGIATEAAAPPGELPRIYEDFLKVNEILFAMVGVVQDNLNEVSPWMSLIDRIGLSWDEAFMRVGIRTARDMAWRMAEELANLTDHEARSAVVRERDEDTRFLGQLVGNRFSVMRLMGIVVCAREIRDVPQVIDIVGRGAVDLDGVAQAVGAVAKRPSISSPRLRDAVNVRKSIWPT